jgi:hypothetical protein
MSALKESGQIIFGFKRQNYQKDPHVLLWTRRRLPTGDTAD